MSVRRTGIEGGGQAPEPAPHEEPPATAAGRESTWTADHGPEDRDITPALGTPGEPGSWVREGNEVALASPAFGDAQWSFLYKPHDSSYAEVDPAPDQIADANRRMRGTRIPELHGPFIKGPVWSWEVPLYFWVGGAASGASFVAVACDLAGDRHSAAIARKTALGLVLPAPVLLIMDLGRPARFLNMLRIFKPRSPMNTGAWCLVSFSASASAAVGADLLRRPRAARALGGVTALFGGYLGSYTGVLLAATAVPLWARSRTLLGPIFVATATATGAAASRLVLVRCGLPEGHPTRSALRTLETGAIVTELALSAINDRRLKLLSRPAREGTSGRLFRVAKASVLAGLGAQVASRRARSMEDVASVLFLAGGLAFRYAWVEGGKASAADPEASAALGSGRGHAPEPHDPDEDRGEIGLEPRLESRPRRPLPGLAGRRLWGELVRRTSLAVERVL